MRQAINRLNELMIVNKCSFKPYCCNPSGNSSFHQHPQDDDFWSMLMEGDL
jgi:hypothetical protein